VITATGRADLSAARQAMGSRVAVVPTMGALHAGHAALLDRARQLADHVILTIFVNPLQFAAGEDLDRYPRTLDADLALAAEHGADLVWAPAPEVVYPHGQPLVRVHPGPAGDTYEGAARPGHFAGVLTVVAKLFAATRPQTAVFGAKDAQQLSLVRRMVTDLDLDVCIEAHPIVRDSDGLALSSRNRYLCEEQRAAALSIPRALQSGSLEKARLILAEEPGLQVAYCDLVDPDTFSTLHRDDDGLIVVAAYAGTTRLLDNATA
jgi:pantoate--beta-alanine ligase